MKANRWKKLYLPRLIVNKIQNPYSCPIESSSQPTQKLKMAVTYEEALATLTSMFGSESGSKWTTDSLDQVLRHHQGKHVNVPLILDSLPILMGFS